MGVNLSPLAGAGWQFFDNNGVPLAGGLLYTYAAGTTTPQATFTSVTGVTANANPIVLNSAGRPASEVWLTSNLTYKFKLQTSASVDVWTMDNIPGISGFTTTTIAALPALPATASDVVFVTDVGREGQFICRAGNPPSDPLQGIYVDSNTAGFYWERVWDGINGRPEWFGAITNSSGDDCIPALHACYLLCPVTQLSAAVYYIFSTFTMNISRRKVLGVVAYGGYGTNASLSCLLTTFKNAHAVQIGSDSNPGTQADMAEEIHFEHVAVVAGVTRDPPTTGYVSNAYAGVNVQFCRRSFITDISTLNFALGFKRWGAIYVKFRDCLAQVTTAASSGTNDNVWGYWDKGDLLSPSVGIAGANASLYTESCSSFLLNNLNLSIGYLSAGGVGDGPGYSVDTYVRDFECGGCQTGMVWQGVGVASADLYKNSNINIDHPILDYCTVRGMEIHDLGKGSMINVANPYVSCIGGASEAILIYNDLSGARTGGSVTITGGQIICATAGAVKGLRIEHFSGASVEGLEISDFTNPVVTTDADNLAIAPRINSPVNSNISFAAILSTNCQDTTFDPSIRGRAGGFSTGVNLAGILNKGVEVNATKIASACCNGGVRAIINGIGIANTGYYDSAGASVAENAATAFIQVRGVIKV